jgi:hypothetical protein
VVAGTLIRMEALAVERSISTVPMSVIASKARRG